MRLGVARSLSIGMASVRGYAMSDGWRWWRLPGEASGVGVVGVVLDERRASGDWARDAIRDDIGRDDGRDEVDTMSGRRGLCSLLSSPLSMRLSLISSLSIYIYHSLIAFIHSSLIAHINSYHHYSINSIHLEISPDPLPPAFPHLLALCLSPAPRAWDE